MDSQSEVSVVPTIGQACPKFPPTGGWIRDSEVGVVSHDWASPSENSPPPDSGAFAEPIRRGFPFSAPLSQRGTLRQNPELSSRQRAQKRSIRG